MFEIFCTAFNDKNIVFNLIEFKNYDDIKIIVFNGNT